MDAGTLLDSPNGIPECQVLVQEFEKCKAGGLPPPATIPTEQELQKREIDAAAQAKAEALAESEKEKQRAVDAEKAHADLLASLASEVADMHALQSTAIGVSAGGLESAGLGVAPKAPTAAELVSEDMRHVHFADAPDRLLGQATSLLQTCARVTILIDAPTSTQAVSMSYLELTKQVWDLYSSGTGNPPNEQNKCRLIVTVGSRFDLMSKLVDKIKSLWNQWVVLVVQVARLHTQGDNNRPTYAILAGPKGEITGKEMSVIMIPRNRRGTAEKEGLYLRCTEGSCAWRPSELRPAKGAPQPVDGLQEIDTEDRAHDIFTMYQNDCEDVANAEAEAGKDAREEPDGPEAKRDYIVDLWAHAHSGAFLGELLRGLGKLHLASALFVFTPSPHPGPWLTARRLGVEAFVLTRRWGPHCHAHGLALGKALRQEELAPASPSATQESLGVSAGGPAERAAFQVIAGPAPSQDAQLIEAYEIVQGPLWSDGINRVVPASVLTDYMPSLLRKELSLYGLEVTPYEQDFGRGLATTAHTKDGQTICPATALYFDDPSILESFLSKPNHGVFRDRVVKFEGVLCEQTPRDVYAVLVGAAQYIQHYAGIRARANATLVYKPAQGFNAGSLSVVGLSRNGAGVAPGQILLNYGVSFDLSASASYTEDGHDDQFKGALDALFAAQALHLPVEASDNAAAAATEAATAAAAAKETEDEANKATADDAIEAARKKQKLEELAAEDERKKKMLEEVARRSAAFSKLHADALSGSRGGRDGDSIRLLDAVGVCWGPWTAGKLRILNRQVY